MALTFDCVLVAAGREPSGLAGFIRHAPDGLRRSANKVSAIGLAPAAQPKNEGYVPVPNAA